MVLCGSWSLDLLLALNILTWNWEHLHWEIGKFGPPYLGKATAATRAALLSPTNACWVFLCFHNPPNTDMDYRIFNVHMWSFYTPWCMYSVQWKSLKTNFFMMKFCFRQSDYIMHVLYFLCILFFKAKNVKVMLMVPATLSFWSVPLDLNGILTTDFKHLTLELILMLLNKSHDEYLMCGHHCNTFFTQDNHGDQSTDHGLGLRGQSAHPWPQHESDQQWWTVSPTADQPHLEQRSGCGRISLWGKAKMSDDIGTLRHAVFPCQIKDFLSLLSDHHLHCPSVLDWTSPHLRPF